MFYAKKKGTELNLLEIAYKKKLIFNKLKNKNKNYFTAIAFFRIRLDYILSLRQPTFSR